MSGGAAYSVTCSSYIYCCGYVLCFESLHFVLRHMCDHMVLATAAMGTSFEFADT